jgi:hypothetical protein
MGEPFTCWLRRHKHRVNAVLQFGGWHTARRFYGWDDPKCPRCGREVLAAWFPRKVRHL